MEYAFLVQTCDLPPDIASIPADESGRLIAQGLAALAEPLQRSLESFDRGGWHVVSHNVAQVNGALILTFLITRQRPVP
jgi:hypothetical protein